MGSSFLSEVDDTSILRTGALHRYHYPLTWLSASRLLLPRSGLERSDFVRWHKASVCAVRPCPELGLKPTCRLNARTSHFDPKEAFRFRSPSGSRNAHLGGAFLRSSCAR